MKNLPVLCFWLGAGFFLFCSAQHAEVESSCGKEKNTKAAREVFVVELNLLDRKSRIDAQHSIGEWLQQNPAVAVSELIDLATDDKEPHIRERAVSLLRNFAIPDYDSIGEGYCGIQMDASSILLDVPHQGKVAGAILTFVSSNSAAEKAGIKTNDAIISIDGKTWKHAQGQMEELRSCIRKKGAGSVVKFGVLREGKYAEFAVTLTRRAPELDRMLLQSGGRLMGGNFQNQPLRIDQEVLDKITEADKQSEAFLTEWLQLRKVPRKDK